MGSRCFLQPQGHMGASEGGYALLLDSMPHLPRRLDNIARTDSCLDTRGYVPPPSTYLPFYLMCFAPLPLSSSLLHSLPSLCLSWSILQCGHSSHRCTVPYSARRPRLHGMVHRFLHDSLTPPPPPSGYTAASFVSSQFFLCSTWAGAVAARPSCRCPFPPSPFSRLVVETVNRPRCR